MDEEGNGPFNSRSNLVAEACLPMCLSGHCILLLLLCWLEVGEETRHFLLTFQPAAGCEIHCVARGVCNCLKQGKAMYFVHHSNFRLPDSPS